MSLKLAENELSAVKKSMGSKKLWKKFSENSFELEKERKGMEFDGDHLEEVKKIYGEDSDTYKSCKNSYEIDKLNFEARENEYEAKIAALLSDYDTAWLEYAACLEYNKILRDKLSILKVAYDSGNVSELDYLEQYSDIKAEMSKIDNALVKADLLGDRLKLIEEGVLSE